MHSTRRPPGREVSVAGWKKDRRRRRRGTSGRHGGAVRETVHDCRMAERVGVSEGSDGRAGKTVDISYIRSAAAVVKWAPRGAGRSRCPTANRRRLGFL